VVEPKENAMGPNSEGLKEEGEAWCLRPGRRPPGG
jgi:hypothetical protein